MKLKVGDSVRYVDEVREVHTALVTAIHSRTDEIDLDDEFERKLCINAVWVSSDPAKRDPYGNQLERASSIQGRSEVTANGRYWEALPIKEAAES